VGSSMRMTALRKGDIVQLDPNKVENLAFSGCFMVITDPKPWGAQGYVQDIGTSSQPGGLAYYRAKWEEMELIGHAEWTVSEGEAI